MIQKPIIKFLDRDTSSLKDSGPNSHLFPAEISPKDLDNRFGQNKAAWGSPGKGTIT